MAKHCHNDFAVTLPARYKSKARKGINEAGLGREDFSKCELLLEVITERNEEGARKTKV